MADSQSSPFRAIALAVRDQLASVTGLDAAYVRIVANDDYEVVVENRYLVVRCYGPEPYTDAGVGRRARPCHRLVRVYIYTRSNVDQAGGDDFALADDNAHFDFEESVLNALDEWVPLSDFDTDGDGNREPLTIEPLHPVSDGGGKPVRKAEDDIGMLRSHLDFQVTYVLPSDAVAPNTPE